MMEERQDGERGRERIVHRIQVWHYRVNEKESLPHGKSDDGVGVMMAETRSKSELILKIQPFCSSLQPKLCEQAQMRDQGRVGLPWCRRRMPAGTRS